jgi:hypothetical protein
MRRKMNRAMMVSAAIVALARQTVEKSALSSSAKNVSAKELVFDRSFEEVELDIVGVGQLIKDLRTRFFQQRFGPPPKRVGREDLARSSRDRRLC